MTQSKIQVKPELTTLDDAMQTVMYNRLTRACRDAGGLYAVLADDGTMIWQFTGACVRVLNAPFEFAEPSHSTELLFANFAEWLELPSEESTAILRAVASNEPVIDPTKAPPEMVSAEAKND